MFIRESWSKAGIASVTLMCVSVHADRMQTIKPVYLSTRFTIRAQHLVANK